MTVDMSSFHYNNRRTSRLARVALFFVASLIIFFLGTQSNQLVVVPGKDTTKTPHAPTCPQEPCNLSIVFIGDSLSRFMYYSLVYFLRHNQWIDPASPRNLVIPSTILGGNEKKVDWMPWFNASTAALSPYENCDCYRTGGSITRGSARESVVENRYYFDPTRNNTVVYFQAYGTTVPIRGHWRDPREAMRAPQRKIDGEELDANSIGPHPFHLPFLWSHDHNELPVTIEEQVGAIRPDVLVMNYGKWGELGKYGHEFGDLTFVAEVVAAIQEVGIPRVIWRTTTADRGGLFEKYQFTDRFMCAVDEFECLNVTGWTSKLQAGIYIDGHHFREPVYRKMNEELLQMLGVSMEGSSTTPSILPWEDVGLKHENGTFSQL